MPKLKSANRKFKALCHKYRDQLVNCTYCGDQVVFREWIHHLKTVHDAKYPSSCVYCAGRMTWNWGDTQKLLPVAQHRVDCLLEFIKTQWRNGSPWHPPTRRLTSPSTSVNDMDMNLTLPEALSESLPERLTSPDCVEASNLDDAIGYTSYALDNLTEKTFSNHSAHSSDYTLPCEVLVQGEIPDRRGRTLQWESFYFVKKRSNLLSKLTSPS